MIKIQKSSAVNAADIGNRCSTFPFSDILTTYCHLSVEVVVQVALLVLCAQHVHDFAVLGSARWALCLAFGVTFKAVLVEGMAAQEVN